MKHKMGRMLPAFLTAFCLVFGLTGCDLFGGGTDEDMSPPENLSICTESTVSRAPEGKKYQPTDSFELMDGNYYYIFYLGIIDWVPLNPASASGFYYSGKEKTSHTFSLERFVETETVDTLRTALETGVSLSTKTYVKDSVGVKAGTLEAKVEAGIENSMTTSVKETLEHRRQPGGILSVYDGGEHEGV